MSILTPGGVVPGRPAGSAGLPFGQWIYGNGADGAFTVNAGRTVVDGVLDTSVPGSLFLESATANFTAADVGQAISAQPYATYGQFPIRIVSIVSPTKVLLNGVLGGGGFVGVTVQIGGFILIGQYTSVTIPAGVTARMAWNTWDTYDGIFSNTQPAASTPTPPFFQCSGTFTINGTLDLSGASAVGAVPGESVDGCGGSIGATGDTGGGNNAPPDYAGNASTGVGNGAGGSGISGPGGIGVNTETTTEYQVPWGNPIGLLFNQFINAIGGSTPTGVSSTGIGGASGAGDGANNGGAGGEGGQFVLILARHIVHGPANVYNLQGGNGGNATVGNCGGGGGGGRGFWATISDDLTGNANIVGTGGLGGFGVGTGTAGTAGSLGPGVVRSTNT